MANRRYRPEVAQPVTSKGKKLSRVTKRVAEKAVKADKARRNKSGRQS